MAAKKKSTAAPKKARAPRKKRAPKRTSGRVVDGVLHLEPADLSALELGHARVVAARQSALAAKTKIGELVALKGIADRYHALVAQQEKYQKEAADRELELQSTRDRLSAAYALDFSVTGYDEDSGKLISDGGSGPPIQAN